MNSLYKQFERESNLDVYALGLDKGKWESRLEKFAEMIVRECAKFLDENSGYDDSNNAWHPEPEDMMKHFGVE